MKTQLMHLYSSYTVSHLLNYLFHSYTVIDPIDCFQNLSTRTPNQLTIQTGGPGGVNGDTYLKPLQIDTHNESDHKALLHDGFYGESGDRPKIITPTSKLLKNFQTTGGCSRTTPVIWSTALGSELSAPIKEELCPTSSSESRRSYIGNSGMNFVNIKIEPRSPNCLTSQALESNNRESHSSLITTTMDMSNPQIGSASHYTGMDPRDDSSYFIETLFLYSSWTDSGGHSCGKATIAP